MDADPHRVANDFFDGGVKEGDHFGRIALDAVEKGLVVLRFAELGRVKVEDFKLC